MSITNVNRNFIPHSVMGVKNNNAWVVVNNAFLVTGEVICQWFSRETKSRVKIIGKSHHDWQKKSLFTVTNVLFYCLHAILCPEHRAPSVECITYYSHQNGRAWGADSASFCGFIQNRGLIMSPHTSVVLCAGNNWPHIWFVSTVVTEKLEWEDLMSSEDNAVWGNWTGEGTSNQWRG